MSEPTTLRTGKQVKFVHDPVGELIDALFVCGGRMTEFATVLSEERRTGAGKQQQAPEC